MLDNEQSVMEPKESAYYANFRPEMMPFVSHLKPNRILDIGCGAGNFRTNFQDVEYWGIEPEPNQSKLAKNNLSRVLTGTYDAVQDDVPDHYFDLIVCNDVIEHMLDPHLFLSNIKKKLSKAGHLLVSLPNTRNIVTIYDLLVRGRLDYAKSGVLDYTHLHLFTIKSFRDLAERSGWIIKICRPLPPADFRPLKRIFVKCASLFIPEIGSNQFGALLQAQNP